MTISRAFSSPFYKGEGGSNSFMIPLEELPLRGLNTLSKEVGTLMPGWKFVENTRRKWNRP